MKIVVVGGTGLIGKKLVTRLTEAGHGPIPASPSLGISTITGEGLAEAMTGATVVVDVSNSPSFEPAAALEFFESSTRNLRAAEETAGVGHHVALSVVGTERLLESGYFRAKIAQETLIQASPIPWTIVRATQFFEFIAGIADSATDGTTVRLPPALFQPMAAGDVTTALAAIAIGSPHNAIVEIAGPEPFPLDDLIRHYLAAMGDRREVRADPTARYFGAALSERTLLPGDGALLGETPFDAWLATR
jgi:uncharacterized protein YbjT (DUF2867 family)